jgi:AbrB family looped-hinge helix DNA binding protein
MTSTATVRERGQVTIPKEVREATLIEEGVVVEFDVRDDGVFMRPRIVVDGLDLEPAFIREIIETTHHGFDAIAGDETALAELRAEQDVFDGAVGDGLEAE